MSLLDFQIALGRNVRRPVGKDRLSGLHLTRDERARVEMITKSAGFRFTIAVQESWSVARAGKAARLTLSILPVHKRRRILYEWVRRGGGTASFHNAEADAFLDYVAEHLPDPSHELTLCKLEKGTHRASEGSRHFVEPDLSRLDAPNCVLRAGRYSLISTLLCRTEATACCARWEVPSTSVAQHHFAAFCSRVARFFPRSDRGGGDALSKSG